MIAYLHIGLPKCGSTFLQHHFFPKHPDLFHIGKSQRPMNMPADMRRFLFSDLIDQPVYLYDPDAARQMILSYRDQAQDSGASALGISMELLTNMVQGRVSLDERAERITGAMGRDVRTLFMLRNPLSWMASLYATYVREGGLVLDYAEWCAHACYEPDVSFFANFLYDRIFDSYAARIGAENLFVLPYEQFNHAQQDATDGICDFFGVSRLRLETTHAVHARPSPLALGAMLALNRHWRFALGGPYMRRMGGHRTPELYTDQDIQIPDHVGETALKHAFMYRPEAEIIARAEDEKLAFSPLDLTCPPAIAKALTERLAPHMRRITGQTGLPLGDLGYPL